jgi:hypothetical protein
VQSPTSVNKQLLASFATLTTTITAREASRDGNFERYQPFILVVDRK